jgi:CIC family chloride channel protein
VVNESSRLLPHHRRRELRLLAMRSHQVVTLAALTGALTGLVVAGFDRLVVDVAFARVVRAPNWLLAMLPGVGLLIAFAARRFLGPRVSPSTADEYLHAFHDRHHELGWRALVARTIAAVATLGSGVPMGLEGPSLYAGATIGAKIQRRFKRSFRDADERVLLVAGAAAGVSAIFKAPATGAVFALEVPYQGDLARRILLPALVASASGYLVFAAINGTDPLFPVAGRNGFRFRDLAAIFVLGALAGLGARAFAWLLRRAKRIASSKHAFLAVIVAGVAIGAMFAIGHAFTHDSLVLGSGYRALAWAGDPTRTVWALLAMLVLRSLATSAAVAGGGVGGLFIPLVVAGALTGAVVGGVVDRANLGLFIVIGVAAFLGAGYRVPLASIMFVAETTGRPSFVVPGLIAAVAAELVMGHSSVTAYQVDPNATNALEADASGPLTSNE